MMPTVTKTVGATGRDYSTLTLWEADWDNDTPYDAGDHIVGECYADADFEENVTLNGGNTLGLASITLTVAAGQRHDGTRNSGARINSDTSVYHISHVTSTVPLIVEWLEITAQSAVESVRGINAGVNGSIWRNLLIYGLRRTGATNECKGFYTNRTDVHILNCMVFDINATAAQPQGLAGIQHNTQFNGNGSVHNCTVVNITSDSEDAYGIQCSAAAATLSVKNNVVCLVSTTGSGKTAVDFAYNDSTRIASNNASEDDTADDEDAAANHITGLTPGSEFVSTTEGFEDLHLRAGASCIGAGVDLGTTNGVNIDIDGRDRDGEGDTWDIGAHQFSAGGPPPANTYVPKAILLQ